MHSRSSLKNHTRFQTKMGKVYTRFQTKTEQKPTWRVGRGALTLIASKGVLPASGCVGQPQRRLQMSKVLL